MQNKSTKKIRTDRHVSPNSFILSSFVYGVLGVWGVFSPLAPWLRRISEWTVAHAARCSQRGQRCGQRRNRYANHRLPKIVLFHKLLMFNSIF